MALCGSHVARAMVFVLPLLAGALWGTPARGAAGSDAPSSQYTSLTHPPCRLRSVQTEGANSEQVCPGVFGYHLLLLDSDGRMSATVVAPGGKRYPLDFWNTVTPHFSSVGKRAEWIVGKKATEATPVAVILPLNVNENPDTAEVTPYLVVARIASDKACVVRKFKNDEEGRAEARKAADSADEMKCLAP
jgi:hypothetical protein